MEIPGQYVLTQGQFSNDALLPLPKTPGRIFEVEPPIWYPIVVVGLLETFNLRGLLNRFAQESGRHMQATASANMDERTGVSEVLQQPPLKQLSQVRN